jgi:hypothetical protein
MVRLRLRQVIGVAALKACRVDAGCDLDLSTRLHPD